MLCRHCQAEYDDARYSVLCPHTKSCFEVGGMVRFATAAADDKTIYKIHSLSDDSMMIRLAGMCGEFPRHCLTWWFHNSPLLKATDPCVVHA